MKRISYFLLAALLSFNMMFIIAYASNDAVVERIDYDDGSYALITIERTVSRSTTSDSKAYVYFSPSGEKCFSYTLNASFTYDGKTSRADTCYSTVSIYSRDWVYEKHSEYVSGNTAYGNAVFPGRTA